MDRDRLRVLLVEDDEDDYIIVSDLLRRVEVPRFTVKWVSTYTEALDELRANRYDVCLLDYRLGSRTGLELLLELRPFGVTAPIILLTGQGDYDVDVDAMEHGASDYLVKGGISSQLLERSIRYAISHKRSEQALRESERQLRSISARLLTTQEEERKKISREIHDIIGSSLSAIKFGIENVLFQFERGNLTAESINAPLSMSQHALDEARRIMSDLRPSLLDDIGIIATLSWFCRQFQSIHPDIAIERNISVEEEDVPERLKIVIFRLIQEALNNVAKHSKAHRVVLGLKKASGSIVLTIRDDGIGFAQKESSSARERNEGLGLSSMRERTEFSGGILSISSRSGKGTAVKAVWPADIEAASQSCPVLELDAFIAHKRL